MRTCLAPVAHGPDSKQPSVGHCDMALTHGWNLHPIDTNTSHHALCSYHLGPGTPPIPKFADLLAEPGLEREVHGKEAWFPLLLREWVSCSFLSRLMFNSRSWVAGYMQYARKMPRACCSKIPSEIFHQGIQWPPHMISADGTGPKSLAIRFRFCGWHSCCYCEQSHTGMCVQRRECNPWWVQNALEKFTSAGRHMNERVINILVADFSDYVFVCLGTRICPFCQESTSMHFSNVNLVHCHFAGLGAGERCQAKSTPAFHASLPSPLLLLWQ